MILKCFNVFSKKEEDKTKNKTKISNNDSKNNKNNNLDDEVIYYKPTTSYSLKNEEILDKSTKLFDKKSSENKPFDVKLTEIKTPDSNSLIHTPFKITLLDKNI